MPKPHLICHMAASIDGRILPSRWRPDRPFPALYETLHDRLGGDAWIVGRVTGQEFARADRYPDAAVETFPREPWFATREATAWGVVLDAHGKIAWGRADIGGDPILVVLTRQVSDACLAGLRADGVSYVFAGESEIDLGLALEILDRELGIRRLLLEGGGVINGAFLRAGLIDEVSLIVWPVIDGAAGAPSVFDSSPADADAIAPLAGMTLSACETLEGGAVWLRYALTAA